MIKNYDPNIIRGTHKVTITLQKWDYIGHIYFKIGGNCKGLDILKCCDFENETFEDCPNDCNLSYDENYDEFYAVLKNTKNEEIEVTGDEDEFNQMIVAIEITDFEEDKKMNPLIKVDASLYFKVSNSEAFGGKGSTGYGTATTECEIIEVTDSFVPKMLEKAANKLNVRTKDVQLISKEEYDKAIAKDEDTVKIRERYIG